jgi:hypothetical protein
MLKPIDKRAARSWAQYLLEARLARLTGRELRKRGPRLAVVGHCQSAGVARALQLMHPSAIVDHYPVIPGARLPFALLAQTLATYDHVFAHEFAEGHIRGGDSDKLRALTPNVRMLPLINFAAFHPDSVYVGQWGPGPAIFSPLGAYHSALALFAFRKGLSLEMAQALFNDNVFRAVGYFGIWDASRRELLAECKEVSGLDMSAEFMSWTRRGVFMHTINHPKSFVLTDIAKRMSQQVGLAIPDLDFARYEIDEFADEIHPIFPIYPPVAAFFGERGSYTFRITRAKRASEPQDYLNLPQFLSGAYKKYAQAQPEWLNNPRVQGWLDDAHSCDLILGLARENMAAGRLASR